MSAKKIHERDFLKEFSVALHELPDDDAELVLYLDAHRMYLLGLVNRPQTVFKDMQATFRRAKDIKKKVVATKDVDLDRLVRYFQNDLPALRMALPRKPPRSRSAGGKKPRSPVDLLEDRKSTGKALRKVLRGVGHVLAQSAEESLSGDDAARALERAAFGRRGSPALVESLARLQRDKKDWEISLSGLASEDEPPRRAAGPLLLDDQAPWYPIQIFALRLAESLRAGKRPAMVVARCRRAHCGRAFVRMSGRDWFCSEGCRRKRVSRRTS